MIPSVLTKSENGLVDGFVGAIRFFRSPYVSLPMTLTKKSDFFSWAISFTLKNDSSLSMYVDHVSFELSNSDTLPIGAAITAKL